jgi:hypothetical protein
MTMRMFDVFRGGRRASVAHNLLNSRFALPSMPTDEPDTLGAVPKRPLFALANCELETLPCSARSRQKRRTQ